MSSGSPRTTADILVLSVGFTGLLVAKALAIHRDRSKFTFALAGRGSKKKLDDIVSREPLIEIKTFEIDIADQKSLAQLVSRFRVVISCTSQYWKHGEKVVRYDFIESIQALTYRSRACIASDTHCLNLTGEVPFMWKSISLFDGPSGAPIRSVVIHACGYESVPSDICTFESVQKLRSTYGSKVEMGQSTTAADLAKAFVSRGTAMSAITMLRDSQHSCKKRVTFQIHLHIEAAGGYHRVILPVGRTTYGENFTYAEFLVAPSTTAAFITSVASFLVALLLIYIPPIRWIASVLLDRESTNFPDYKYEATYLYSPMISLTGNKFIVPRLSEDERWGRRLYGKRHYDDRMRLALYTGTIWRASMELVPFVSCLTPMTAFGSALTTRLVDPGFYDITTEILE
ncbi:hypothetical protein C8J56DRAFT_1049364 [Mycena floridula]|nr:hypothetical protein C8J56DRAFT_1049364 [Mycena floridula]